jgi:FKBP-type peptidyl-prolyl cis-trans isomerase FklB
MPDKDTVSYAIGMSVARTIKRQELTVDVDTIATAMKDVLGDRPTRFTEKQLTEVMQQMQGAMRAKMQAEREVQRAKMEKEGETNKMLGEAFLAKNAKADGVKTLTNGLQYKVIKDGTGPIPASNDIVTVSYAGRLIDGTEFDHNTSFTTAINGRIIKGWSAVLSMMKVGSKWEVTIPSELGYGPKGSGAKIGPNSVLVFDMELLSVTNGPPKPPTSAASTTPPSASAGTPVVSGQIIKVPSAEELKKGAKIEVITNAPGQ